jgi:hypothetical protein
VSHSISFRRQRPPLQGDHHRETHLWHRLFAAAAAHAHPINDISLLGLVPHSASFIRPAGAGQPKNAGELPKFPASHAEKEAEYIALLLLPKLLDVLQKAYRVRVRHRNMQRRNSDVTRRRSLFTL